MKTFFWLIDLSIRFIFSSAVWKRLWQFLSPGKSTDNWIICWYTKRNRNEGYNKCTIYECIIVYHIVSGLSVVRWMAIYYNILILHMLSALSILRQMYGAPNTIYFCCIRRVYEQCAINYNIVVYVQGIGNAPYMFYYCWVYTIHY